MTPEPLIVDITHEPFLPWCVLTYNGQTEELDHQECLDWFKAHGARDMDKVNEAVNQALNFYRAQVIIEHPTMPGPKVGDRLASFQPKI